ncbi:MAG: tetratricopeptide repeat protein [Candidatus Zixiibacteriota bacterium]
MLSVAHLDERIEKCLAILADNPHSQVFAALAEAYRKRGDFGRAFSICRGGLKHHPNYAPAHLVLAKLYLHQGMVVESLASLQRAAEIDGATRATDFVEAEIRLAMGDVESARTIIDRLRATDRHDPVVKDLGDRLKGLQQAAASASSHIAESAPPVTTRTELLPGDTVESATHSIIDWPQWSSVVREQPHVTCAFVFVPSDPAGGAATVEVEAPPSPSPIAMVCARLFQEAGAELSRAGGGSLDELRVEHPGGEVWCRRYGDRVVGFAGDAGLSFGAVRRIALNTAERVNACTVDSTSTC